MTEYRNDKGEPLRMFIAIDLPASITERIHSFVETKSMHSIRQVAVENMHITLFFLGTMDYSDVEETMRVMGLVDMEPFKISVSGIGTLSRANPRILLANIIEGKEDLRKLYESLHHNLTDLGIKRQAREYVPHITVARMRKSIDRSALANLISESSGKDFGSFTCDSITLKGSVLTSSGPIYTNVYSIHFQR